MIPSQSSRDTEGHHTAVMAFLLSVLQCLLLSCVLLGPGLTHASYQQSGSDISPEEAGLNNLRALDDATVEQVVTAVAEMVKTSVLQATAEAHSELSSQLSGVQSSLEELSQLTVRLEAVEKAVSGIQETSAAASACQESLQKTMTSVSSRQEDLQASLSNVLTRQNDLQSTIAIVSSSQEGVQETLKALTSTQSNMTDGVVALSGQLKAFSGGQQGVQYLLDIVPTRKEVQQSLATKCSRDEGLSDVLSSLSSTQQEVQQAVSGQNSRLDGLAESLAVISDRQRDVQEALDGLPSRNYIQQNVAVLSSRLDWTQTLQKLTKRQEETLQTLSSHSTQLDGVTDSLAAISDQQRAAQRTLSAQSEKLDGAGSSLSVLSERQQAVQRVLSEQSGQLTGVAEVVSRTPVPAGRPSLVTGRLLGEPCRSDTDCSTLRADTVCGSGGLCQCAAGLQPVAGEACRPYPRLSEPCRATSHCRGATELADCADNRCACPHGLFNFNNSECRSGLGIGEPCRRDNDCSTLLGLTCSAGTCAVRTCDSPGGSQYRYRLVGGASCDNGLIQFSFNAGELWQYVCDSDWTQADAAVACRYLGFAGGAPLPWNNTAVDENNFFSVKNYVCKGSERSLSRCRRVYGRGSCAASELAMVQCSEE